MAESHPGVLTDVGTNELEVVEFFVDGRSYVINVAKVREIVRPQKAMPVPHSQPTLLGVFRNREDVIPLIDLGRWLGSQSDPDPRQTKIIVAEFNRMKVGFLVHGVSRIHRTTWADLEAPTENDILQSSAALGFIRLGKDSKEGERIVFLLDFESIVKDLAGSGHGKPPVEADERTARRTGKVVLIVEDSALMRKTLTQSLEKAGYTLLAASNGEEAWGTLDSGVYVDAVVTDIEMPRMDGHHLTHRIKNDDRFKGTPVILYSSMIYEEMRRKGEALGADAQICKPDLPLLLETVDGFVLTEEPVQQ